MHYKGMIYVAWTENSIYQLIKKKMEGWKTLLGIILARVADESYCNRFGHVQTVVRGEVKVCV